MFIKIIIAIVVGIIAGTFTGLTPGVHINLISIILLNFSSYVAGAGFGISPLYIAVTIIAMGITHTFLDSIPSTFLGCPDADMALAALPAHKLLMQGKGRQAIKLTTIGSLICLIMTTILILASLNFLEAIYKFIQPIIGFILLGVVCFMVLKQKKPKRMLLSLMLFLMSGALGLIVLNLQILKQPLLPMLSGLFGISTLLLSLSQKVNIPSQGKRSEEVFDNNEKKDQKKKTLKALLAGTFSGSLTGLFPGLGSAQAAVIGQQLTGDIGDNGFLVLVGGINTVNFLFSLGTFYAIQKARNGAVIAVMDLVKQINLWHLFLFLTVALVTAGIACFLAVMLADVFAKMIVKVNYSLLCLGIIGFVSVLVIIFSGWVGLFIMIISTAVGMLAPLLNIPRNNAMGCILLPVILFFLL